MPYWEFYSLQENIYARSHKEPGFHRCASADKRDPFRGFQQKIPKQSLIVVYKEIPCFGSSAIATNPDH